MVYRSDPRSAAQRYASDHVDGEDPDRHRERVLAEDEVYQSLAVAFEQLDRMDIVDELPRHESTFANAAASNLELALEERASTVLDHQAESGGA